MAAPRESLVGAAILLADHVRTYMNDGKLGNGVLLRETEAMTLRGLAQEVRGRAVGEQGRQGMMPVEPCEKAVLAVWHERYTGEPDLHNTADGQRLDAIRRELRAALVHQRHAERGTVGNQ